MKNTENINLVVIWDYKSWIDLGVNVNAPEGFVQTISEMDTLPKIKRTKEEIQALAKEEARKIAQEIKSGEIINVGTGTSYSIKEIADMISDNQRLIEPRPTEIENSLSDINKAKNLLLWNQETE